MPKTNKTIAIVVLAICVLTIGMSNAIAAPKKITVAYFPGWPGTWEVGWAKGWFEKEMGVKVNFREFDSGAHITTAMASGDVQMGISVGGMVLGAAVSQGAPLKLVGIAENIGSAENLVARNGSGIISPADLRGKTIALPYGTNLHYKIMGLFKIFGIKESEVKMLDMACPDIVAAYMRKDIDVGFVWEPFLSQMLETGHLIVSAEDIDRWGYFAYGAVIVHDGFAKENPMLVSKFLKVFHDSTLYYRANPDESYKLIGEKAGVSPEKTRNIMKSMGFYTIDEQLSADWIGSKGNPGMCLDNMNQVVKFLLEQKTIDKSLDNYAPIIDSAYLEAIK